MSVNPKQGTGAQVIPLGKRLTFRILLMTAIGLLLTLAAIAYTLLPIMAARRRRRCD